MADTAPAPSKKPRRRWRRALLTFPVYLVMVLVIVAGLAALWMKGRSITAPLWVQDRIEARLARELPQARVSFGEMVLVVDEDWVPRVRLRDIDVSTPAGQRIVSFTEFKASFALDRLMEGIIQPRDMALSGIFVTLRRGADGRVSLSGGDTTRAPAREAATLPELVSQLDDVLERPALLGLREVDLRALTMRYVDVRADRAWTVDGGRLRLVRDGDDLTLNADLAVLSGGAGVATLAANYSSQIGETAADFGVSFDGVAAQDIALQGPAFAWLGALRAPISGSVRSGLDEEGTFAPLNATLQIGAGAVQPNPQARPIPFDGARSYFSYDPGERLLTFDTVSVRSQWVSGEASGTAILGGVGEGAAFSDLVGQFALRDIRANPDDLYDEPVDIAAADVDFQLKLDPFRLRLGRLQITDQGRTLRVDGGLQAGPEGWRVSLDGFMDALAPDRLLALWPQRLKPKTRTWLADNLLKGEVQNIDLALRLEPDAAPRSFVSFDYTDANVRYVKTLPPITDAAGHFSLVDNRLVIAVAGGTVMAPEGGPVDVRGSSFIIPDVSAQGGTPSVVRLTTRSSATAALSLLNLKPLQVMDKAGLPVDLAEGQISVEGTLAVPLKQGGTPADVVFHGSGVLQSVVSDTLIKDRRVTADRLTFKVANEGVSFSGKAALDGVGFYGVWAQPIGPGSDKSKLSGLVVLDENALDTFGIALPSGTVSGAGQGRITVDLERGTAPRFTLTSDLQGLRLSVPQLSWIKPANQPAALEVTGRLGDVPRVDKLALSGAGLTAQGSVTLKPGGALDRVSFDRVAVGSWLDVPVDLVGRGAGQAVQVVLRGGALDLRTAAFGSSGGFGAGGPAAPPMQVALDRLQITDTIALTNMRGSFETGRGLDGTFEALLNGGAPVSGQVIPQNGRSAVRLVSQDAGGVLRAAGLLKQVVGGDLSLTLLPVGSGGAFDGRVTAKAIRVKNAPGIAALLNAISVVGLVNELNGDGIYFEDVEGDFRLTPNSLTLTKGSAVGASMGLSMDGVYALETGTLDMQGVITPVYLLNGVGSVLTRKGEGLIGFSYTLSGPARDPQVGVNPLSALAPGMFRDIFRKPAPEVPEVDGVTESTLPQAEPETSGPVVRDYEGR